MSAEGVDLDPTGPPGDHATDAERLAAVAAGSRDAFEAFYVEHGPRLYGLASRMCGPSLGGDVVVETFIALWDEPQRFRPVRRSLGRLLLAEMHRRAVLVLRDVRSKAAGAGADALVGRSGSVPLVRHDAVRRLAGPHLASRFEMLSDEERDVVVLAYFGGYTCDELVAVTGRPRATVTEQMDRALHALRDADPPP